MHIIIHINFYSPIHFGTPPVLVPSYTMLRSWLWLRVLQIILKFLPRTQFHGDDLIAAETLTQAHLSARVQKRVN